MMMLQKHSHNRWRRLILGAGLFGLVLYLGGLSSHFKPTPDSCEYMGLAQSLARGDGYQFNGRSGSRYPPLLPLLLAGLIKISEETGSVVSVVVAAKITQIALAVVFVLGAWRLAQHYLSERQAMGAALLIWANLTVFQHCMFILSDILYGCLSIWALVLLGKKPHIYRWIGGGILISLAWLTRSVGLLLAAGVAPALILAKPAVFDLKKRWVWTVLIPLLCAIPFFLFKYFWAGQESGFYWHEWVISSEQTSLPMIIWTSFKNMALTVPFSSVQILLNIETMSLPLSFALIIFAVLLLGWGRLFRKHRALPEWYAMFYAGIMSIWISDQGPRFYLPVLPLWFIYAFCGFNRLRDLAAQKNFLGRTIRILIPTLLLILIAPAVQYYIQYQRALSAMVLIRNGYIYPLMAALALVWALIMRLRPLRRLTLAKTAPLFFLLPYLSIGWLYTAGFACLEHGFSKSRGPMLAGYEPYWQMGIWLKQQVQATEPILCAQSAIVHLASGIVTREPDDQIDKTWSQLINNDYTHVLWLTLPESEHGPTDVYNEQIGDLIDKYPHNFQLQAQQPESPSGKLYRYIPQQIDKDP